MTMPTRDQLATALSNAIERYREKPVTDAEREAFRANKITMGAIADDCGVTLSELQAMFSYELFKITGNTALPKLPDDPPPERLN